tara:strand:- start:294 stop:452 length:159 start_codon:yes stop_codon:yes gene_type:complete
LKAEIQAIQEHMFESKKSEHADEVKEVKRLCKEFFFTSGSLKNWLTKGIIQI